MAAIKGMPIDADSLTSVTPEANATLARQAARSARSAPKKLTNSRSNVGGNSVKGGAKIRGGSI